MKTALLVPIFFLLVNLNLQLIQKRQRTIYFFSNLLCVFSSQVVFFTATTSAFWQDTNYCPSADSILPCQCISYPTSHGDKISLVCSMVNDNLDDSKFSEILQAFVDSSAWNELVDISAYGNSLITKIPLEISRFPSLSRIVLSNNKITSIQSGAFDLSSAPSPPSSVEIDLSNNEITSIDTGAFNFGASTNNINLNFDSNQIATISPDPFQGEYRQDLLSHIKMSLIMRFCLYIFLHPFR